MKYSKKAQQFIANFESKGHVAKVAAERAGDLRYVNGFGGDECLHGYGQKWLIEKIKTNRLNDQVALFVFTGQEWKEVARYDEFI